MTSKIELENVTYIYGKDTPFEVRALDSVNLSIYAGMITGIIGHTGSGNQLWYGFLTDLKSRRAEESCLTVRTYGRSRAR